MSHRRICKQLSGRVVAADADCFYDHPTMMEVLEHDIGRRYVLKGLLAALVSPLMSAGCTGAFAAESISRQVFRHISRELLGTPVDAAMADALFAVFSREAWGMDHLLRLRRKLLYAGKPTEQMLDSLDAGERWFLEHFLTTWITGIYYHQSGNRLISYEHALMHQALLDIRPVPGLSDRAFGFWADAPRQGKA